MNKLVAGGWTSLVLMLPLLMGAKGGCGGGQVSMGTDYMAEAGQAAAEGGRDNGTGGGLPETGGKPDLGVGGKGGTAPNVMMAGAAGGAGEAGQCEGFDNTRFQDEVTVRYVNDGDETMYVGRRSDTCDGDESYELRNEAGDLLGTGRSCLTCELLLRGDPRCPTDCPQGVLVRIDPGGSYDFSWSGTYWVQREIPKACPAEGFDTCLQLVQAPPADYHFVGKAWSDLACDDAQGCSPCTPEESGSCLVSWPGLATGTSRDVEAVLNFPMEKRVELHFN
jgi:hypothetical protein